MASMSMTGPGNVAQVAGQLKDVVLNSGISCELVGTVSRSQGGQGVQVMVFEKYYWRAGNRASLTLVVSGQGNTVCVDAISSGGGQGPIFKFSWGAEKSFVGIVSRALRGMGFR
nr:DUF6054 family protein [bacterium]